MVTILKNLIHCIGEEWSSTTAITIMITSSPPSSNWLYEADHHHHNQCHHLTTIITMTTLTSINQSQSHLLSFLLLLFLSLPCWPTPPASLWQVWLRTSWNHDNNDWEVMPSTWYSPSKSCKVDTWGLELPPSVSWDPVRWDDDNNDDDDVLSSKRVDFQRSALIARMPSIWPGSHQQAFLFWQFFTELSVLQCHCSVYHCMLCMVDFQ